jgi:hypothetical protein
MSSPSPFPCSPRFMRSLYIHMILPHRTPHLSSSIPLFICIPSVRFVMRESLDHHIQHNPLGIARHIDHTALFTLLVPTFCGCHPLDPWSAPSSPPLAFISARSSHADASHSELWTRSAEGRRCCKRVLLGVSCGSGTASGNEGMSTRRPTPLGRPQG